MTDRPTPLPLQHVGCVNRSYSPREGYDGTTIASDGLTAIEAREALNVAVFHMYDRRDLFKQWSWVSSAATLTTIRSRLDPHHRSTWEYRPV
jgi:hypothetical protein